MFNQNAVEKMNFLGSRFLFFNLRRTFRPAGLIRQNSTKSYTSFCKNDLEKLKKLSLHSVYLTYWCPPPGIPLSALRMEVSKVSLSKARFKRRTLHVSNSIPIRVIRLSDSPTLHVHVPNLIVGKTS